MMAEEYLTIKQFAAAAGVSEQAIYKRLNKSLKPYYRVIDGKKMIDKEALALYANSTSQSTPQPTVVKPVESPAFKALHAEVEETDNSTSSTTSSTTEKEQIQALNRMIDMVQKELDIKNKQIEDLNNRLAEALKTVEAQNILISQQQHLSLLDKTDGKQSQTEAKSEMIYAEEERKVPATATLDHNAPMTMDHEAGKGLKGLLKRLFG